MSGRVFCLDFDGVLVDSAREVGLAGYKTLHAIDSVAFGADAPEAALSAFVLARPVLETGWEAVLMLWLIESGASPADLLRDFQTVGKARALEKLGGQDAVMAASMKPGKAGFTLTGKAGSLPTNFTAQQWMPSKIWCCAAKWSSSSPPSQPSLRWNCWSTPGCRCPRLGSSAWAVERSMPC